MIDFDVIFPMESLEFTKSFNFGRVYRKKTESFNFSPKN